MLKAIEAYLALRRATGFAMLNAEYLLKSFAAFATERGQTHVHTQTAIDWAARGPSVAQRDARLKAVCRFVRHVRVEDARHEVPPVNHFGARKSRRSPHIYSAAEIDRLIEAALRLRPKGGLRSRTYATLIALLSVTGLRISEGLKLTVADVTRDGLLIRETKFRKTRLVPLHGGPGACPPRPGDPVQENGSASGPLSTAGGAASGARRSGSRHARWDPRPGCPS
jgi:integrase/recombinase XerD